MQVTAIERVTIGKVQISMKGSSIRVSYTTFSPQKFPGTYSRYTNNTKTSIESATIVELFCILCVRELLMLLMRSIFRRKSMTKKASLQMNRRMEAKMNTTED